MATRNAPATRTFNTDAAKNAFLRSQLAGRFPRPRLAKYPVRDRHALARKCWACIRQASDECREYCRHHTAELDDLNVGVLLFK